MARTQLAEGRPAEALGTVAKHEQQFPAGRLTEERESVWIQALVASGHFDAARTRAQAFRGHYPHSLSLRAVEEAVESAPADK